MMLDCMTVQVDYMCASIPLIFLLGAGGFVVYAYLAKVRDDVPATLLDLYLATCSY